MWPTAAVSVFYLCQGLQSGDDQPTLKTLAFGISSFFFFFFDVNTQTVYKLESVFSLDQSLRISLCTFSSLKLFVCLVLIRFPFFGVGGVWLWGWGGDGGGGKLF